MQKKRNFSNLGLSGDIIFERSRRRRAGIDDGFSGPGELRSLAFFKFVAVIVIAIFVFRLFFLTVIEGAKNRSLSDNNRIALVPKEALRGQIYDRNGKILASSSLEYYLIGAWEESKISQAQVAELEGLGLASLNFQGELGKVEARVVRSYPLGEKAAHVLGYTARVSQLDLQDMQTFTGIDSVGKVGVEASYDSFLRGRNGRDLIEVDSVGHKVSILGSEKSEAGGDLKLTIDGALQDFTYFVLKRQADKVGSKKAAAIIEDPNAGEILALVSYPSFDPENIAASVADREEPYFNRAISGVYPPGSVFKIVSALAGLESGRVNRDTEVEDVGEFYLGDVRFANWFYLQYGQKDGILKLERAIARSNDIFFYRLAEIVGLDPIRQMAIKLGFGQKTGIDLSGEEFGLVPDEVWKKAQFGQVWFPGDTMHLGIGQGFMLVTPTQVSQMTSFMASGKVMKPYIVSSINKSGSDIKVGPEVMAENLVKRENFEVVRTGMKMACQRGGTGWPFFDAPYVVGCKTGTAERAEGNPNAWFTAFAPFGNPQIAVTVLIEDGGEGSSVAGPVAREILDFYVARHPELLD